MEGLKQRGDALSNRDSSPPRRSSSTTHSAPGRRERKWTPSWLSRSGSTKYETVNRASRRISTSTTGSSTISTGTRSSIDTRTSEHINTYQLPTISSGESDDLDCGEGSTYNSVNDATAALQSMALSIPEDEEAALETNWTRSNRESKDLPPVPKRSESRARSTRSRVSRFSSISNDETIGLAEVELVSREYIGYWRPSQTAHIPLAAAICGTMLLTTKLPAKSPGSSLSTDEAEMDAAAYLCEELEEARSPEEALKLLHDNNLQVALLAVRQSFDTADQKYVVPDKVAWAMYEKIAEARNHPEKIGSLWNHISKLLKRIPQNIVVVMMLLLSIARRVQSRGILINGASPAVFLLQNMFPRYVGEDASRILLKNYDSMPDEFPQVLESVNYRFPGGKCNILALVASKRPSSSGKPSSGRGGVQEIRVSEEREMQW